MAVISFRAWYLSAEPLVLLNVVYLYIIVSMKIFLCKLINFKIGNDHTPLLINPFQSIGTFHIETNYLICIANQMTGFYIKCNTGPKRVQQNQVFEKYLL